MATWVDYDIVSPADYGEHGVNVLSSGQELVTFLVAVTKKNGLRKQGLFWLTV